MEIAFTPQSSGSDSKSAAHLWDLGAFFVNMGSVFSVLNETVIQAQGGMCIVAGCEGAASCVCCVLVWGGLSQWPLCYSQTPKS